MFKDEPLQDWGCNEDGGTHEMWIKIALVLMLYFVPHNTARVLRDSAAFVQFVLPRLSPLHRLCPVSALL